MESGARINQAAWPTLGTGRHFMRTLVNMESQPRGLADKRGLHLKNEVVNPIGN